MRYGVTNVKNLVIGRDANTTNSTYPAVEYKVFRKFKTRDEAREYKRTRRYPQRYPIIDLKNNMVVR